MQQRLQPSAVTKWLKPFQGLKPITSTLWEDRSASHKMAETLSGIETEHRKTSGRPGDSSKMAETLSGIETLTTPA